MIRKRSLTFILLWAAFLCISCDAPLGDIDDPGIDFVLDDIIGIWEFPDQNGDTAITVEIFTSPTTDIFIKRTDATYMTVMAMELWKVRCFPIRMDIPALSISQQGLPVM